MAGTADYAQLTFADEARGWAGVTPDMTVLRSRDGGQTWTELVAPFGVTQLMALQAIPARPRQSVVDRGDVQRTAEQHLYLAIGR